MLSSECNVWFDQAIKQRQSLYNLLDAAESKIDRGQDKHFISEDNIISSAGTGRTIRDDSDSFKNIKLGGEQKADQGDSVLSDENEIKHDKQQPILSDALEFLDHVKVTTAYDPQIYNKFLDIMKDFKSGAIDTPSVMERIAVLFATNMVLIQSFNMFLPPGYFIGYETDGDNVAVRVIMPGGESVAKQVSELETENSENEIDDDDGESCWESHSDIEVPTE
jgi:histone deacetylase complex regulatory component SIN3